ncbi:MAG: choline dehydrogenase [Thermodesulfobacteriota bacterium]|nr:MAG: choline dehydrogenase [Thermodesulfobacteriota bacterium]
MSSKKFEKTLETDVVIIGSGAGGACAAWGIANKGIDTLVIEKGDWLKDDTYDDDELHYYILKKGWPSIENEYSMADLYRGKESKERPHRMGQSYGCVGGGTIYYAGVSSRFYREDFEKYKIWGDIPGANLADWPKGFYEEIGPYYSQAEELIGVSGDYSNDYARFNQLNHRPRLLPPLPYHKIGERLNDAAKELGWNPFPIPLALNSIYNEKTNSNWCISSGMCSGYPCAWGAKNSVDQVVLSNLVDKPNFSILTNTLAAFAETDSKGNISGVVCINRSSKEKFFVKAKAVILACSGILSPLFCLNSQTKQHQNGLGNSNDLVGRNLMFHIEGQRGAQFDGDFGNEEFHNLKKVMVTDFYIPDQSDEFVNHMSIQMGSKSGPIRYVLSKVPEGWGRQYLKDMHKNYMQYHELQAMCEDLPQLSNRVTAADRKDVDGMPVAHIHHRFHKMDGLAFIKTMEKMEQWLQAGGGKMITGISSDMVEWKRLIDQGEDIPPMRRPYGYHLMGTLRMGDDPDRSVVNRYCQFHEVPNLFCVDSSIFPTSAGVNPTLTIQANALRVADKIINLSRSQWK